MFGRKKIKELENKLERLEKLVELRWNKINDKFTLINFITKKIKYKLITSCSGLVVDDEHYYGEEVRELLSKEGYRYAFKDLQGDELWIKC